MALNRSLFQRVVRLGVFTVFVLPVTAQTPASELLIAISGERIHALEIVDPLSRKVVGRVPIDGGAPHEIAVSADGKLAFATNTNFGKLDPGDPESGSAPAIDFLSVIDIQARKEVRRVETGEDSVPHGIAVSGGKVFFTAEGYQIVGRYDPPSNKIDWMFGTTQIGTHKLVVTKDMNRIFTSSLISDTVVAIEPWDHRDRGHRERHAGAHMWMTTVIPVGHEPEGIAMSPDEKEVWALNRGDGSTSVINTATKSVSKTLDLKVKDPSRLQFSPDGKRVIICDRTGNVLVYDAATKNEIRRIVVKGKGSLSDLSGVYVAPDSSRAYVSVRSTNSIAVIDLVTLEVAGSIPLGGPPEGMAWVEKR